MSNNKSSYKSVLLERHLPDIDDTIPFEYLERAEVTDLSGNKLTILKDGNETKLYFGTTHDTVFLTETEIENAAEYYHVIKADKYDPVETIPGLIGATIASIDVKYASDADEIMETPELVNIVMDTDLSIQIPAVGHIINILYTE